MKPILTFLLLAAAAFADVTGKWTGTLTPDSGGNPAPAMLILKQEGTKLTGTAGPNEERQFPIDTGKIDGNNLTVELRDPSGNVFKISMAVTGDQAKGTAERTAGDGTKETAKIEVARAK